jgi:glycosyltransferase involved in cell wall biosynthesis
MDMSQTGAGTLSNAISIIIPVLNGEKFIADAIRRALGQDCDRPVEVIVVDDGSTDGTAAAAARFDGVTLISTPNGGQSAARNVGIARATGDYLVFLDHDDILVPGSLRINSGFLDRNPDLGFVAGDVRSFQTESDLAEIRAALPDSAVLPALGRRSYRDLLRGRMFVPPSMCMFRRALVQKVGGFRQFAGGEDLDLFVRVGREAGIGVHDYPCTFYRRHGTNLSRNVALMLASTLSVLERQRAEANGDAEDNAAIDEGRDHWITLLRPHLPNKALWAAKEMRLSDAAYTMAVWFRLRSAHMRARSEAPS